MPTVALDHGLKVFSTCPPSSQFEAGRYLRHVTELARRSEEAGCEGILVCNDNGLVDPWLTAQVIIEATRRLAPLVAVEPSYMHPYTTARMVTSLGFLYGRRVHLNMAAGGFSNDLAAPDDESPHDERYARLIEYISIVQRLLGTVEPPAFEGRYYKVTNSGVAPPLPAMLKPIVLLSGTSQAAVNAARALGAIAVEYPKPCGEYAEDDMQHRDNGIRIGIIARADEGDAWRVARSRFPEGRKGPIMHEAAMKGSSSSRCKQLSEQGKTDTTEENPCWLVPFETPENFCPYLVGSYDCVADEVARYLDRGYRTFVVDVPASPEEMRHIGAVFERATCSFAVG
jgi:alkanesulfonate monooxygenase